MKYTKRINYLITGCLFLSTSSAFFTTVQAQTRTKHKESSQEQENAISETNWMQQNLVLSPEQFDRVSAINDDFARSADSLAKVQDAHLKTSGKTLCSKNKDAQLKTVLTAEQYKTYIAHKGKKYTPARSPFTGTY